LRSVGDGFSARSGGRFLLLRDFSVSKTDATEAHNVLKQPFMKTELSRRGSARKKTELDSVMSPVVVPLLLTKPTIA
jgi:hypothetical protein